MSERPAPPEHLIVGRVLAPRGNRGEVKVEVLTDFPDRFEPGNLVYLDTRPLHIESSRPHKRHLLVKLSTVDSIDDAEKLRGRYLTVGSSELRELPEDEYYAFQIIGLRVKTGDGVLVGRVADLMRGAGNDIYVVESDRGEILIPAVDDFVKSVDLEAGEIVVEPIEGLLRPQ
jgi:16S rRNA processing protein RimM